MIHPPDVIPKYAPDAVIGVIGSGGGGGGEVQLPPGVSGYTMEEVAKHTSKSELSDRVEVEEEKCSCLQEYQATPWKRLPSTHPNRSYRIGWRWRRRSAVASRSIRLHHGRGCQAHIQIGVIGSGGGGGGEVQLPPGVSGYTMEEVAKHTSKSELSDRVEVEEEKCSCLQEYQ